MIDFNKFTKYSKPGPRYTSYPTALEFNEQFNTTSLEQEFKNQDPNKPLSLYLHLPFCRSACYFCGCNVIYTSKEDKKERYIDYIQKELEILSKYLDTSRQVIQMHLGGGTPTFFSEVQLKKISGLIIKYFKNFSHNAEISCEVDPRFFTQSHMEVLKKAGFNRISFGVQDFNPKVQEAIHRVQSYQLTKDAINIARDGGVDSVNIDLIYGLPYQSLSSFKKSLDLAYSLDGDRYAIFNYAHVPWLMKSMRKIDETTLPSPSVKLEILKYTIDFFETNGYKMVGMDHFAKPSDELFLALNKGELHRNFQGYTTKYGADLIGIGLSSIGEGDDYYVQNLKNMQEYENMIDSGKLPVQRGLKLNKDDLLRKYIIMELMSNFKLDINLVEKKFDIDFKKHFADEIERLQLFIDEDILTINNNKIQANQTGSMLIRNIAMIFDRYMINQDKRFSKTI
jgi:oxygen-independent coproporphyrinogen-3 oxidase